MLRDDVEEHFRHMGWCFRQNEGPHWNGGHFRRVERLVDEQRMDERMGRLMIEQVARVVDERWMGHLMKRRMGRLENE